MNLRSGQIKADSPVRKKPRLAVIQRKRKLSKEQKCTLSLVKRSKKDITSKEPNNHDKQTTNNFILACKQVSCNAYFNNHDRFMIIALPDCLKMNDVFEFKCLTEISSIAKQGFKIDFGSHEWCDALNVCRMSLSHEEYLSANVMKDILEIIMNAHEDSYAGYSLSYVLDQCQQILSLMFHTHPPSLSNLRKCYQVFLTSPLSSPKKTFSNRSQFSCQDGFVSYCFRRLDSELAVEREERPLVYKNENIPRELQKGIKGLFWQKENLEIFETLNRTDRIQRIMIVLQSVVELLQIDLAVWNLRPTTSPDTHIIRKWHRPLMAAVLWPKHLLCTGTVNSDCSRIISLFVDFIRLGFPESFIHTMTLWLNTAIQTFYIADVDSGSDYPHFGKYCAEFADKLFEKVADLPIDETLKIMRRIHPTYMRYMIGLRHLKDHLSTKEDDVLKITIVFLNRHKWKEFPSPSADIVIPKPILKLPKTSAQLYEYFSNVLAMPSKAVHTNLEHKVYPKRELDVYFIKKEINQHQIIEMLYLTFKSYIEAYSVQELNGALEKKDNDFLNSHLNHVQNRRNNYEIKENFVKEYRNLYRSLREVLSIFQSLKSDPQYSALKVFETIIDY